MARPARPASGRRILSTGWALAVGIAAALIIVFPLVWVFANSIKPESEIITAHPGLFSMTVTGSNYVQAWDAIDFPRLFLNTVIFAGGVTLLSLTFDSLTAYALARLDFPGKNVIFVLVLVTLMLPFQVNLVPLFLFLSDLHWLNTYQGLILPRATNAFGSSSAGSPRASRHPACADRTPHRFPRGTARSYARPLARSTRRASTVMKPRQSASAAGDQDGQLNIQPPSSRWAAARWSRCASIVRASNSRRAIEPGSGAKSSGENVSPSASGSSATSPDESSSGPTRSKAASARARSGTRSRKASTPNIT